MQFIRGKKLADRRIGGRKQETASSPIRGRSFQEQATKDLGPSFASRAFIGDGSEIGESIGIFCGLSRVGGKRAAQRGPSAPRIGPMPRMHRGTPLDLPFGSERARILAGKVQELRPKSVGRQLRDQSDPAALRNNPEVFSKAIRYRTSVFASTSGAGSGPGYLDSIQRPK